jgi:hypothetical protein
MWRSLWQWIYSKFIRGGARELTCEECLKGLDYYIEWMKRGGDPNQLKPSLEDHLKRCKQCRMEFQNRLENRGLSGETEHLEFLRPSK